MKEPRRVVGTENDVRVDGEIFGDTLMRTGSINFKYDVTNNRSVPIVIAELLPNSTYDQETQMVTVELGSEIPGEQFLPRLIAIAPGEKKSFSTGARIFIPSAATASPWAPRPSSLRLKINFIANPGTPFRKLIDIPERAVHDPALAAELFSKWVESNETVTTNALPMRWIGGGADAAPMDRQPPPPRRRPGGT